MLRPEQEIHRAVIRHLDIRGVDNLVYFHVPNGMQSTRLQGAIFKSLGVRAGVSDLICLHGGKMYALEIKAPGKKPTAVQKKFLNDVLEAGGVSAWADSIDAALSFLEAWHLLHGKAALASRFRRAVA